MKRSVFFIGFVILTLVSSGCLQQTQKLAYVCPSGDIVNDPTLCAIPTETPQGTSSAPITVSEAPPTTLPPSTSTTSTPPPTTAPATTTTTSSTTTTSTLLLHPPKPVLEIVDEALMQGPGGEFWIGGGVKNNGDVELFLVQTRLTLYDRFGGVLRILNSAPIEKINPGETVKFNLIKSTIPSENVATYNLTVHAGE